jgi:two-component system, chemotaxis family, chemotaxis protein CheY
MVQAKMTTLDTGGRALPASDDGLAQEYLAEYRGHLAAIRTDLLAIARGVDEIEGKQLADRVLRAVHSIRGALFFGWVKISELAQELEDSLALTLSHQMVPKPYQVGILLRAADRLGELMQNPGTSNNSDIALIIASLGRLNANPPPSQGIGVSSQSRLREGSRPRILAVDDDVASRLLLQTFLSRYSECDVAVNGREAVEAFRSASAEGRRYDLICMDIMMPEMDGREAVRQVRALEETDRISRSDGAKIVIMTAVDDMKEMIGCFEDFSDAYLIKPVSLTKLLRHLKSCHLVA